MLSLHITGILTKRAYVILIKESIGDGGVCHHIFRVLILFVLVCVCSSLFSRPLRALGFTNGAPPGSVEDSEQRLRYEGLCVRGPVPFTNHSAELPLPASLLR